MKLLDPTLRGRLQKALSDARTRLFVLDETFALSRRRPDEDDDQTMIAELNILAKIAMEARDDINFEVCRQEARREVQRSVTRHVTNGRKGNESIGGENSFAARESSASEAASTRRFR